MWLRQELNYSGSSMFSSQDTIKSPYSKESDGTAKTISVKKGSR